MSENSEPKAAPEGEVAPSPQDGERAESSAAADVREDGLVPGWLALLVLVLVVAVGGVGGFVLRGWLSGDTGEVSPARADIVQAQHAAQASPSDPAALLSLAYAYQQDQQYDRALEQYKAVLAIRPKDVAALYNTGVIHMLTGNATQGEIDLWDVLEIDPTHALAAMELGDYYAAKNQYKSLLKAIGPALEAKPSLADLQYLAGLAYEHLGDRDQAVAHYQQALRFAPDTTKAREGLTRLGVTPQ